MYTSFYNLREKPFSMAPHADFFYESHQHSGALSVLEYGLREGHGLVLLTGEAGTGKTMITEYLIKKIAYNGSGDKVQVAVISNAGGNAENLVEFVLLAFGLDSDRDSFAGNLNRIKEHVSQLVQRGIKPLLVFDEAQQLTRSQLEQVRMFTNFTSQGQYLLHIFLIGQPELMEILKSPDFKHMAQRIAVSHHLHPLSYKETGPFIRHRLVAAGASNPDLFSADAVEMIFEHSRGLPRIINMLCDAALVTGYAEGRQLITRDIVERVIMDWESAAFGRKSEINHLPSRSLVRGALNDTVAGNLAPPYRESHPSGGNGEGGILLKHLQGQEARINGLESFLQRSLTKLEITLDRNEEERKKIIESRVKEAEKDLQSFSSNLDALRGNVTKVTHRIEKIVSVFRGLDEPHPAVPASGATIEGTLLRDSKKEEAPEVQAPAPVSSIQGQRLRQAALQKNAADPKTPPDKSDQEEHPSPDPSGAGGQAELIANQSSGLQNPLLRFKIRGGNSGNKVQDGKSSGEVNSFLDKVRAGWALKADTEPSSKEDSLREQTDEGSNKTLMESMLGKNNVWLFAAGGLVVVLQLLMILFLF